jgi:phosphoribosylformylglycinamidine synthase PurS subunit
MKATVTVMLKTGVLDPQGAAVKSALGALGFGGVEDVRQGKVIELDLGPARPRRRSPRCAKSCWPTR